MLQKNKWKISLSIAVFLSLLSYFINNCPVPYWDSLDKYCWLEYILRNTVPEKTNRNDVFFINVSYDRQVVDYNYSNGNLHGTIDITNRKTLLDFLKIAERTNTYKYIFFDIRFEKGINTKVDSELFAQIKKMRDISFSHHSDLEDNDKAIASKAAVNDYFTTITSTNFTRYQFLQNGLQSAPLRIYTATDTINNKPIVKWGPFYFCGYKLCYNSPFMRIPEDFWKDHEVDGHQNYFDLGPLLMTTYEDEDWRIEMKDKIVIVGDFVNDLHDTYAGMQPGSYLVYLAYKELCNGKHFIPWFFVIVMFIVYMLISLFIVNNKTIWNYIPLCKKIKNRFVVFVLNMIGYGTVLSFITVLLYVFFKTTYNIFFPSLVFSLLGLYTSYKNRIT